MSTELLTVDAAADVLKLHPKTVLRFIREGKLKAARVGRSYRILPAELQAFAGMPLNTETAGKNARVTSIVDVPGVEPKLARKWATMVTGALHSKPKGATTMHAEVIHEPERSHLKIVLIGTPSEVVNLLSLIRVWLEQLRV